MAQRLLIHLYMSANSLIIWFILIYTSLSSASAGSRVRLKLPNNDLHLNILRFTDQGLGRAIYGKIIDSRYYPEGGYSIGYLGTTSCELILNQAQRFSLKALLKKNIIDETIYEYLENSSEYLRPEQVTFVNVHSLMPREEYESQKSKILPSQMTLTPEFNGLSQNFVPITVGTLYLVNGYRIQPTGVVPETLPWARDPVFKPVAQKILGEGRGPVFEMGRAVQVAPGVLDYALDAIFITIAQEIAALKIDMRDARIFVHSYKHANTIAYQKRAPSLQVVATDPNNAENVILMTTLESLYNHDHPWNFSGSIQVLRDVDRDHIDTMKAWGLIWAARAFARLDLDYYDVHNRLSRSPIVLRDMSVNYSRIINAKIERLGLKNQDDKEKVIELLNAQLATTEEGIAGRSKADPVMADSPFLFHQAAPHMVSITNLDPELSREDEGYELRVLMGSLLFYREILDAGGINGETAIRAVTYAISTTHPEIKKRLAKLEPSIVTDHQWNADWGIEDSAEGVAMSYTQATVSTYQFKFSDIHRLAIKFPEIFAYSQNRAPVRAGYFHTRTSLERPIGL